MSKIVTRARSAPDAAGGVASLVLASVVWGTTGTAQALAHAGVPPPVLGAARLASGAVALALIAAVRGARGRATASGRRAGVGWHAAVTAVTDPGRRGWVFAAGAATAVYQAAFFAAVARTGVALGTLVALGSAPVFCGLLARVLIAERVPRGWAPATVCAVAGSVLLLVPGARGGGDAVGIGLSLLAGAAYALYTVAVKQLLLRGGDGGVLEILVASVGTGAVLLLPVLLSGAGHLGSGRAVLLVGWLGLVATVGGYLLFAHGLARVAASTAGTLSLTEPLIATALGTVVLSEHWSASTLAGAGMLVVGLTLAATAAGTRPRSPAAAPSPRPPRAPRAARAR